MRRTFQSEADSHLRWNNGTTHDYIKDDTIRWVDDPNGFINIYEDVLEGYPYVIGGDTKGEGTDFYAGTVINNATGERTATIHMQISNSKALYMANVLHG